MTDYKTMYLQLFNKVTDAIELLQEAQRETERLYMESEEAEMVSPKPQADTSNASRN